MGTTNFKQNKQRLDAISEIVQFVAVGEGGYIRHELIKLAFSLKDLAKQMAQTVPRAPRFADADLLDRAEPLIASFYAGASEFVERNGLEQISGSRPLATECRGYLLSMLMLPFMGSQRAQTVAQLTLPRPDDDDERPCATCGDRRCLGNQLLLEPAGTVRVRISHHKNQLAGRTRVRHRFCGRGALLSSTSNNNASFLSIEC